MKHTEKRSEDPPLRGDLLRRRDFLIYGSAGLLAPMLPNLAWAAAPPATEAAVRPLSVGYIADSETYRNLQRLPPKIRRPGLQDAAAADTAEASPIVVPADSLLLGDTALPGRPLRIKIHGLYPPTALDSRRWGGLPLGADLEALFPSPDPAFPNPLRFFVWSLRRQPGWNPSPPVSFRFPLDWQALPQFVLRVRTAKGESMVLRTKFTLDAEAGRPRLRRGLYVLGFTPGAWTRDVKLVDFARAAPASLFSILVSMDPEGEG